jgi:phytoene dehydrogenase-like protein
MRQNARKIVIIGGGIPGLCAAVYARTFGYEVELLEMHDGAGGLATSWRRDGYTIETCLHWLLGSNPRRPMYARWQDVFDIGRQAFVDPEEYVRLETEHGERLSIYADVDRMEAELVRRAPQDAAEIRRLASAVRRLATFAMSDLTEGWPGSWLTRLHTLPYLPLLRRWSRLAELRELARTQHDILREVHPDVGEIKEHVVTEQGEQIDEIAQQVRQVADRVTSPEAGDSEETAADTAARKPW